jgi:membrane-associated phospholipid phosphatase
MAQSTAAIDVFGGKNTSSFPLLLDRWLLLGAYGPRARFHMIITWSVLAGFVAVEALWLSVSQLHFAEKNWAGPARVMLFMPVAFGLCWLIANRLADATDRVGNALRQAGRRVELFAVASLVFTALPSVIMTYCYLGTAAALPLRDAELAAIDRALGFDWPGVVAYVNSSSLLSWLLPAAYCTTPYMLTSALLWLCMSGQGARLAEFLALSCITFIGIAIGMMIWPAEGAYAYFNPPLWIHDNIGAGAGMWHHDLLMAVRSGADKIVDFDTPNANCLVTFPSGHTILAIIVTYAVRDRRWTLIPAAIINMTMLVSTVPNGGHYVIDVIAGAAVAGASIFIVRLPLGIRHYRLVSASAIALARA